MVPRLSPNGRKKKKKRGKKINHQGHVSPIDIEAGGRKKKKKVLRTP